MPAKVWRRMKSVRAPLRLFTVSQRLVSKLPPEHSLITTQTQNARNKNRLLQKAIEECRRAGENMAQITKMVLRTPKNFYPWFKRINRNLSDSPVRMEMMAKSKYRLGYNSRMRKDFFIYNMSTKGGNNCNNKGGKNAGGDKADPYNCVKKSDKGAQKKNKDDPCKKKDTKKEDPCKKKETKKEDPCKKKDTKKEDPCKKKDTKKEDPCKKKDTKKEDPCKRKDTKKEDPCKKKDTKKEDPCKKKDTKKEDPCKKKDTKKEDPCKKKDTKKEDPCKKKDTKKEDPCKKKDTKKEDPCKKKDTKKEDPCKKKDTKKEDPCKKKDTKKEDPCKKKDAKKEDPCKKKEGPSKKNDPCKKAEAPQQSVLTCKQEDPCAPKTETVCQKVDPCKKTADSCTTKEDPSKRQGSCAPPPPPQMCVSHEDSSKPDPCKAKKCESDPCKKADPCKREAEKKPPKERICEDMCKPQVEPEPCKKVADTAVKIKPSSEEAPAGIKKPSGPKVKKESLSCDALIRKQRARSQGPKGSKGGDQSKRPDCKTKCESAATSEETTCHESVVEDKDGTSGPPDLLDQVDWQERRKKAQVQAYFQPEHYGNSVYYQYHSQAYNNLHTYLATKRAMEQPCARNCAHDQSEGEKTDDNCNDKPND